MKSYIYLFFILISSSVFSQQTSVITINPNFDAEIITGDILGNIYMVKGSELFKYDEKGILCCSFSDKTYGEISSVDVRDPLRILLFYKPFAIVRLLDNKLAEQSLIDLRKLQLADPLLVCTSETQGMWVYDNATSRLYKYDAALQPVSLSNDLRQDIMHTINPTFMAESDYWLVMLDKNALLVFDKMGSYFKPLTIENGNGGLLVHDEWIFVNKSLLVKINIRNGKITENALPFSDTEGSTHILPGKIVRSLDKKVEIYSN
ncbi:MAG: hypothetical protein ABI772_06610 [Bacteroidota bacterium]